MKRKIIIRQNIPKETKWQVETGDFKKIVRANNYEEAISSAFNPDPPSSLGVLTRIRKAAIKRLCPHPRDETDKFIKWNYIDSIRALEIAGYSVEDKRKIGAKVKVKVIS